MLKKFKNLIYHLSSITYHLTEYGFYLLVFLLPWQTRLILRQPILNRGPWEYGTISLYGTDILLVILLVLAFLSLRAKAPGHSEAISVGLDSNNSNKCDFKIRLLRRFSFCNDNLIWIILSLLDLAVFISIFFASDKLLASYKYVLFLLGLGLFWLINRIKYSNKKLAWAFFSSLVLQGVLALEQFFNQAVLASKWLGMAKHLPADLGTSVIETVGKTGVGERWLRAYGSLDHPNILGGFLTLGLIVVFWLIINYKRQSEKKTDYKFIIYYLSFIIALAGLIFSFSRSSYLALIVGIIIFIIFYLVKKDWLALKRLGGLIILSIVFFGIIFLNYQNLFITRVEYSARLETKSAQERKLYLDDSWKIIKQHWLTGVGIGNYTLKVAEENPKRYYLMIQPVHNVWFLVLAETGIFGLIFFIALLVLLFFKSWQKRKVLKLSILLALVIMMSLDHYLWSLHFGVLLFWLLAGIVQKNNNLS